MEKQLRRNQRSEAFFLTQRAVFKALFGFKWLLPVEEAVGVQVATLGREI